MLYPNDNFNLNYKQGKTWVIQKSIGDEENKVPKREEQKEKIRRNSYIKNV